MREIRLIVVHCSDSEWGDLEVIRKWHLARGWSDIGYHFVITNGRRKSGENYNYGDDGIVRLGRDIERIGSHASGVNRYSIGICMIGKHVFTRNQFEALFDLLQKLHEQFPDAKIIGHRDVGKYGGNSGGKTCPNFDIASLLALVKPF